MRGILYLLSSIPMTAQDYGITLPFTGDNSKLGLAAIIMGVALIVIVVLIVSMRRK